MVSCSCVNSEDTPKILYSYDTYQNVEYTFIHLHGLWLWFVYVYVQKYTLHNIHTYVHAINDISLVKRQISCRWLRRMWTATFFKRPDDCQARSLQGLPAAFGCYLEGTPFVVDGGWSRLSSSFPIGDVTTCNNMCNCIMDDVAQLSIIIIAGIARFIRGVNVKHCQPCFGTGTSGRWTRRGHDSPTFSGT